MKQVKWTGFGPLLSRNSKSFQTSGWYPLPDGQDWIVPERRDVHVDYRDRIWLMVLFNWQPPLGLNSRIAAMFPEVIGLDQSPSVFNKDSLVRTSGWSGNVEVKRRLSKWYLFAAELVTNQNLADAAIASSRADDAEGSYMYMLTLGDQVTCSANYVFPSWWKPEWDDVHLSAAVTICHLICIKRIPFAVWNKRHSTRKMTRLWNVISD